MDEKDYEKKMKKGDEKIERKRRWKKRIKRRWKIVWEKRGWKRGSKDDEKRGWKKMMNTYSKMNKKDDDKKELPRNKKNIVFAGISVRGELKFLVSIYF